MHRRQGRRVPEHADNAVAVAASIGVVCLLLYLLTVPGNRAEADDAFWYADLVERGDLHDLVQPYHPLYLPLMRVAFVAAHAAGLANRSYEVMTVAGAMAAAVAVGLFVFLLRARFALSLRSAALGGGFLAASWGFWRYAAEAEVYGLATLLAVAAMAVGFREQRSLFARMGVAIVASVAVWAHIMNVLVAAVILPAYFVFSRQTRALVVYLLTVGILLGGGSVVVYKLSVAEAETSYWGHYFDGRTGVQRPTQLAGAAVGFGQTVVAGNFLFAYPTFRNRVEGWFPYVMLADEKYTGQHAGWSARWLPPATFVVLAVSLTLLAVRSGPPGRRVFGAAPTAPIWLGLGAYGIVIFAVDSPHQPEVWLLALVHFWILVTVWFGRSGRETSKIPALLLGALLVHNYWGGMRLVADPAGDRNLQKASWLLQEASAGDVVLTADSAGFARYLTYYSAAHVVDLQFLKLDDLDRYYTDAQNSGEHLYATSDVFEPPAFYQNAVIAYGSQVPSTDLGVFGEQIRKDFVLKHIDEFGGVYVKRAAKVSKASGRR